MQTTDIIPKEAKSNKSRKYTATSTNITNNNQYEGDFVMGVNQKVWVHETISTNGEKNSYLMDEKEVNELKELNEINQTNIVLTGTTVELGFETEEFYCLNIWLQLCIKDNFYYVKGYAHWQDEAIWGGVETAEESVFDIMAITWGGNGALYSKNIDAYGKYHDDDEELNIGRQYDDPDSGVVWMIEEKIWAWGNIMDYASVSLELHRKDNELQKKQTNVRLTYIHTYQSVNSEWTFSYGEEDGLAAEVRLSTVEKNWRLQIAIPEIKY